VQLLHARTLLFRQLQQFFEQYLRPRWRISDVVFSGPEMAPKIRGQRQRPHEIVTGHFGDFTISIYSTVEIPPLGRIVCLDNRGRSVEGPIDQMTWEQIVTFINFREAEKEAENVY
jgi:hypothetical protein